MGETVAKEKVVKALYGKDASKHSNGEYAEFFNPNKHKVYLKTMFDLIESNYDCFQNIFDTNLEIFKAKAQLVNHYRKSDSHATPLSDADFESFRGTMRWFEETIESFYR